MLFWWWVTLALAEPPDGTPALIAVGTGKIERMAISEDGRVVAGRSRADLAAWLLDVDTWRSYPLDSAGCAEVTGVAVFEDDERNYQVWSSCGDGALRGIRFDGRRLTTIEGAVAQETTPATNGGNTTDTGATTAADTTEADPTTGPLVVDLAETLSGVWAHRSSDGWLLYAMTVATEPATLYVVDPFTGKTNAQVLAGYPLSLPFNELVEGVVVGNDLYLAHVTHNVSRVPLGVPGGFVRSNFGLDFDVRDIAPSGRGGIFGVDSRGLLAEFLAGTSRWNLVLTGLDEPQAVVAQTTPGDEWMLITGQEIRVYGLNNGSIVGGEPLLVIPGADNKIQDSVSRDNYVFGGGEGGNVHITTARPWVYPNRLTVDPADGTTGTRHVLEFLCDEPGSWEVHLNGDRFGSGPVLASGRTEGPDEVAGAEIEVDDSWVEGENWIYVVYTGERGLSGHAAVTINVDNPPKPPVLRSSNLQFEDSALTLTFDGIPDEDLVRYEVWVTTSAFDGEAFQAPAGPAWDGATALRTPILLPAEPAARVSTRIAPLENDVRHYVAVRAVDAGGKAGPMSQVISGVPREVYNATALAGETGGSPCGATEGTRSQSLALLLASLSLATYRRRRT